MRKLIFYFIVLLIAVWLGIKIHANPGYVLISFENWSLETTLWFAILAFIVLVILLLIIFRLIHGTYAVPGRWHHWSDRRKIRKARKLTNRGLCELAEGNWKKAEGFLIRGADYNESPLINYLAAARAAQNLEAFERRDNYLRKAHDITAGSEEMAVGLTQAQLQLSCNQLERALATLRHLNRLEPHHTYVLKLLQDVYLKLHDWQSLRTLLPELHKYEVLNPKELAQLEQIVFSALLAQANKAEDLTGLEAVWESVPKSTKKNPTLLAAYCQYLIKLGQGAKAEELLREALKKNWSTELIYPYGDAEGETPAKQLAFAESMLKTHGHDPALLLCLGKICTRNRLWGKARGYLESSIKIQPHIEAYRTLGLVLEQLNEQEAALQCYRDGLKMV